MAINYTDIEKLAELARIQLNDATIAETTQSIADVLSLVNRLNAIDTKNIDENRFEQELIYFFNSTACKR